MTLSDPGVSRVAALLLLIESAQRGIRVRHVPLTRWRARNKTRGGSRGQDNFGR